MPASPQRDRRHGGPRIHRPRWPWLLLAPGLLWLLVLYLLPLLSLVPLSLSEPVSRFGLETVFRGRLANYQEVLQSYGPILLRSFAYASLATGLGVVLAYPLAWTIRFRGGRWQPLLMGLVVLPSLTSFLVRAIAWTSLLADQGPLCGPSHGRAWRRGSCSAWSPPPVMW